MDDRRLSNARTELSYEMDRMHAPTPARARRRRRAKREWSRANRRHGKALTRNAL